MKRRRKVEHRDGVELCLGLVIVPVSGKLEEVVGLLKADGRLELGPAHGHRIPACAVTELGTDEDLLADIEALAGVLAAEVVYAELLEEETT